MSCVDEIPKFRHIYFERLSKIKANHVKNIANGTDFVNLEKSKNEAKLMTNQPAAKLPQMPEKTANKSNRPLLLTHVFIPEKPEF